MLDVILCSTQDPCDGTADTSSRRLRNSENAAAHVLLQLCHGKDHVAALTQRLVYPFCAEAMIKDPYKNLDVYTSCFNSDTGVVKLMSVLSAHSEWIKSRICNLPWSHCIRALFREQIYFRLRSFFSGL